MKFNWGHGIVIAALLFMGFITTLVYRSMQEKVDFVTDNYYDKELKFQDQIDHEKNSLALKEDLKIEYVSNALTLKYPSVVDAKNISGEISFYKPDNSALDFNVAVKSDENHLQQIKSSSMKKGVWKIIVNWKSESTPYYHEEKIFIN